MSWDKWDPIRIENIMFTPPVRLEHNQKRIENSLRIADVGQAITRLKKVNMRVWTWAVSLSLARSLASLVPSFRIYSFNFDSQKTQFDFRMITASQMK